MRTIKDCERCTFPSLSVDAYNPYQFPGFSEMRLGQCWCYFSVPINDKACLFCRTALNAQTGVCTPVGGLITGRCYKDAFVPTELGMFLRSLNTENVYYSLSYN